MGTMLNSMVGGCRDAWGRVDSHFYSSILFWTPYTLVIHFWNSIFGILWEFFLTFHMPFSEYLRIPR